MYGNLSPITASGWLDFLSSGPVKAADVEQPQTREARHWSATNSNAASSRPATRKARDEKSVPAMAGSPGLPHPSWGVGSARRGACYRRRLAQLSRPLSGDREGFRTDDRGARR